MLGQRLIRINLKIFSDYKLYIMIKKILLIAITVSVLGCNNTKPKDTELTQKKEITDPKETEVWEPEPKAVSFDENNVPSDAIVLFDGKNLEAWQNVDKSDFPVGWIINKDGSMTVNPGTGSIETKQKFGSIQLHLEWSAPDIIDGEGQERGNSGVFFQNRYEVQILDSYQNRTYSNGQATSIYKQYIPLVNAMKSPTEWQTYDIIFHAPEFNDDGKKIKSGTLTVLHNGVLVQDHVEILGTTEYIGYPKNIAHGKAPLQLQDHRNLVSYRNIWIRELK